MLWTNTDGHGGKFLETVVNEFQSAKTVTIASGYVSLDVINKFYENFERIPENGGVARLMIGMAFYEGLSANKLQKLNTLSTKLESFGNGSGVFVSYNGRYHGKLYRFEKEDVRNYFVGSSNFSRSGLSENIESTVSIQDTDTIERLDRFVDFLFSSENAVSILKADIVVPGSSSYHTKISLETLDDLPKYDPSTIDKSLYPVLKYPLSRVVDKEKSNLNVYFGKGRENMTTHKIKARDWYEVELISNQEMRSDPSYPRGDFTAYTDDGYIMRMYTGGDYFKNIRSRDSLKLFGQWIKGKLQKKGALLPLTPVTQDTLDLYGNDSISFYKIDDGKYYMEF